MATGDPSWFNKPQRRQSHSVPVLVLLTKLSSSTGAKFSRARAHNAVFSAHVLKLKVRVRKCACERLPLEQEMKVRSNTGRSKE